ncbi:unnamed protein product [Discosporangium mesarthrocarpum]
MADHEPRRSKRAKTSAKVYTPESTLRKTTIAEEPVAKGRQSKKAEVAKAKVTKRGGEASAPTPSGEDTKDIKNTPKDEAPDEASYKGGPLEVGSIAPAFTCKDQDGNDVTLESFKGKKSVVIYFYPKDNTPGCNKEACKFRDLKAEYDNQECEVLGVSADNEASHQRVIAKFGLNFSLLADTDRTLIKAYGASKAGNKIQRSTVLVGKDGLVTFVWNPVSGAETHPVKVLEKLKELAAK